MKHYTVGYHDYELHTHEICEYADNTFDAMQHAKEDVPFLKDHPQYIDEVLREHSNRTDILIILQDRLERYERTIRLLK